jgi:hypothetical protein
VSESEQPEREDVAVDGNAPVAADDSIVDPAIHERAGEGQEILRLDGIV